MRNFRLLAANEIECRISEISKDGKYVNLLLYKTARTDAALLDETVGKFGWQNTYTLLDGKMYCGIGIKDDNGEWIWKYNTGTESNMEGQKGEASDAMKRAGFVWGIGTELYSAPGIRIFSDKVNIKEYNGKYRCYDRFSVRSIGYDDNENISELVIWNDTQNKECIRWSKKAPPLICADCGAEINDTIDNDGNPLSAKDMAAKSKGIYGVQLCRNCCVARTKK